MSRVTELVQLAIASGGLYLAWRTYRAGQRAAGAVSQAHEAAVDNTSVAIETVMDTAESLGWKLQALFGRAGDPHRVVSFRSPVTGNVYREPLSGFVDYNRQQRRKNAPELVPADDDSASAYRNALDTWAKDLR